MDEIPSRYNPRETEDKWYGFWEEKGFFRAAVNPAKKPFCIVIPPPNVTGILHMGHALNNTIQDILIRYHRMKQEESLWMPGTDHAGIATQNIVEKALARQGLKRFDLGRERFVQRVWEWKEEFGSTIISQLKKLGASCDWSRTRFTMDEGYSRSVSEVFVRLYEKGLIYRGNYIINWCPRCQTALSDEEAPHKEIEGSLYYIKYPLEEVSRLAGKRRRQPKPAGFIVVATTRPETMLGDTAVAVNPRDRRYKKLIGKTLLLPLAGRKIKVIADSMVDMKFATGAVKITPAHDPNDYVLGKKHKLEFINVMQPNGKMNENAGSYKDMDRFRARQVILEDLKKKDLLQKIKPHRFPAGHCYRCQTIIEPYLSKQWFVKTKVLSMPALEAVKRGRIKFYPARWTKVYINWMENIRDWCISRQIWWGHRLPVYYCKNCLASESIVNGQRSMDKKKTMGYRPSTIDQKGIIVSRTKPEKCPVCGSAEIYQDEDVLDTWFSSWLWPFATFYWPFQPSVASRQSSEKDNPQSKNQQFRTELDYFYPTSVLVTAPEIIFFWVARMIMAGLEFTGEVPFRDVYIHGTVRDVEGRKMSKSLGNIIDPLQVINEYGADALRFSIISITAHGQDIFLSREKFEAGRNFANKIWNAGRFVLMNLQRDKINVDLCAFFNKENLTLPHRWILSRLYSTLRQVDNLLEGYRFNDAAGALYGFFWHEFCDWYLEMAKLNINDTATQVIMYKVLEKSLRALHPFMPFITEEIWQRLPRQGESITVQPFPHIQSEMIDKRAESQMQAVFNVIAAIRNLRAEVDIPDDKRIKVILTATEQKSAELINSNQAYIRQLAKVEELTLGRGVPRLKTKVSALTDNIHIVIPLEGVIDVEKERERVRRQARKAQSDIAGKKKFLNNKQFLKKAPREIIKKETARLEELKQTLSKLKKIENELR